MTDPRQRGFTLIELIIFIVVVSVGLVGILQVMNTVVKSSADPMVRKQAMALSESVLEEVMLKAYCDPDPLVTTGETVRESMDDVSDFGGQGNTLFSSPLTSSPLPAALLARYTIAIQVQPDTTTLGLAAKKVTVTVASAGESVSMTGYRTRYGDDLGCAP